MKSIEEYARQYAGVDLSDDRLVFAQIIFYNMSMKPPTPEDVLGWSNHFGMDMYKNRFVFAGEEQFIGKPTADMIPGFQLIDREFILRADSTGHQPHHDLYKEFLPMLGKLVRGEKIDEETK